MKINIIGNGFDMYHGLPSSYFYFGCYLIENNPDLYMEMSKWFGFRYYSKIRGYPDEDFDYGVEEQFWSTFEERLGIVDESAIIDTYNPDLGLEIEDYDIPMDDDKVTEGIRETFIKWVSETLDLKENYKVIKSYKNVARNTDLYKMGFSNRDRFLVFNYTHVLQNIYNIHNKNIYYVHGECTGDTEDNLIFGHGNKKRISEIQKIIDEYDSRSLNQSERTNQLEYECLLRFIKNLEKDVNYCKKKTNYFYNHLLEDPVLINVYGMSYGKVDFPYFEQIRKRWPNTKWNFSYYSKEDEKKIKYLVKKLGIPNDQYTKFNFANPNDREIKNLIIRNVGIVTYEQVYRK